jgi:hypothetical protein
MSVARAVFVVFVGVVATCLAALPCTAQQPIAVRYPPPANQLLYYFIFPTGHTYLTLLLYIVAKKISENFSSQLSFMGLKVRPLRLRVVSARARIRRTHTLTCKME